MPIDESGHGSGACRTVSVLELRRHSQRKHNGGSQLSQQGVELARTVGATMGPFDVVAASVVPRARETAIAMGFAVDVELVTLSGDPDLYAEAERSRWWERPTPFAALASILQAGHAYARYAHAMAALWRDLLTPLNEHARVLVVGHSGELEAALVACMPTAHHASWGPTFGPCEGAVLAFEGDPPHFGSVDFIRLRGQADDDAASPEELLPGAEH